MHGSLIYNYLCNQCISPLTLWIWILLWRGVLDKTLCDKVCQWHLTGRLFSLGTPVSPTNKTDRYNMTEILIKVALNTINLTLKQMYTKIFYCVNLHQYLLWIDKLQRGIGGVIVSILCLSAVDREFESQSGQRLYNFYLLLLLASCIKESKTGWLTIKIMYPSGATFLPADYCFSFQRPSTK